jgi:hypothetical protein
MEKLELKYRLVKGKKIYHLVLIEGKKKRVGIDWVVEHLGKGWICKPVGKDWAYQPLKKGRK